MSTKPVDQLFRIPNNEEGKFFIALMKKYASDGVLVKARGRVPNHKKIQKAGQSPRQYNAHVPLEFANELGIYLQYRTRKTYANRDYYTTYNIGLATTQYLKETSDKAWEDRKEHDRLKGKLQQIVQVIES